MQCDSGRRSDEDDNSPRQIAVVGSLGGGHCSFHSQFFCILSPIFFTRVRALVAQSVARSAVNR